MKHNLFDNDLAIQALIPLEWALNGSGECKQFAEMFEDNHECVMDALNVTWNDEFDERNFDDVVEFFHDKKLPLYLAEFNCAVPRDFTFNENWEFVSFNATRNRTTSIIVAGDTLDECFNRAVEERNQLVKERCDREREEQKNGSGIEDSPL